MNTFSNPYLASAREQIALHCTHGLVVCQMAGSMCAQEWLTVNLDPYDANRKQIINILNQAYTLCVLLMERVGAVWGYTMGYAELHASWQQGGVPEILKQNHYLNSVIGGAR